MTYFLNYLTWVGWFAEKRGRTILLIALIVGLFFIGLIIWNGFTKYEMLPIWSLIVLAVLLIFAFIHAITASIFSSYSNNWRVAVNKANDIMKELGELIEKDVKPKNLPIVIGWRLRLKCLIEQAMKFKHPKYLSKWIENYENWSFAKRRLQELTTQIESTKSDLALWESKLS